MSNDSKLLITTYNDGALVRKYTKLKNLFRCEQFVVGPHPSKGEVDVSHVWYDDALLKSVEIDERTYKRYKKYFDKIFAGN